MDMLDDTAIFVAVVHQSGFSHAAGCGRVDLYSYVIPRRSLSGTQRLFKMFANYY